MSMHIEGTTALVTGANRGLGRALVEALLDRGAAKVYAAVRSADDVERLARELPPRVVALALDVTRTEQIESAARVASDVRLLINNAGTIAHRNAPITDSGWLDAAREELNVNTLGAFAMTQMFAPVLAANGGGAVVNVNSIAGFTNFPLLISYSISKAALHSLTQASRVFLKSQRTEVYGVYPGPIDTRLAAGLPFEKASPASVAVAILEGIENGTEEILPDAFAKQLGTLFLENPKALERQVAAMAAA